MIIHYNIIINKTFSSHFSFNIINHILNNVNNITDINYNYVLTQACINKCELLAIKIIVLFEDELNKDPSNNLINVKECYKSIFKIVIDNKLEKVLRKLLNTNKLVIDTDENFFIYILKFINNCKDNELSKSLSNKFDLNNNILKIFFNNDDINLSLSILESPIFFDKIYQNMDNIDNFKKFIDILVSQFQDYDVGHSKPKCKICYTNFVEVLVEPCNHTVMCLSCFDRISHDENKCVMCRENITGHKKIYL